MAMKLYLLFLPFRFLDHRYYEAPVGMTKTKQSRFCKEQLEQHPTEGLEVNHSLPLGFKNHGIFFVRACSGDNFDTLRVDRSGLWKADGDAVPSVDKRNDRTITVRYFENETCPEFKKQIFLLDGPERLAAIKYFWKPDSIPWDFPVEKHPRAKSGNAFHGSPRLTNSILKTVIAGKMN
jgi:hypothetical protein